MTIGVGLWHETSAGQATFCSFFMGVYRRIRQVNYPERGAAGLVAVTDYRNIPVAAFLVAGKNKQGKLARLPENREHRNFAGAALALLLWKY